MLHDRESSISWRINAERFVLLGWGRAILLQFAHPLVAAGVAEHSSFRQSGATAVRRLHLTVKAMLALAFGDARRRAGALQGILAIHRRVHGRLPEAAGRFSAGTPYTAEDPDLVLWVHATLLESIPLIYERVVGPLTAAERDAYCAETAGVAVDLGARREQVPRDQQALAEYLDRMYASGSIAVSNQARELAAAVLAAPSTLVAPASWINRVVTIGLLPPHIRQAYGFRWAPRDDRRLARVTTGLRALRQMLPDAVALWPESVSGRRWPRSRPDTPAA